jgi:putative Mg2+ transporter-C (MgtC) family protein
MTLYLSWEQIAIRIALACIASLAIGYNRDEHGRPAGMRTVMLVTLTATLGLSHLRTAPGVTGFYWEQ